MLTLDEAIKHCEEKAKELEKTADTFDYSLKTKSDCKECANEHRQLASWLKELKMFKDLEAQGYAMYKVSEVMQNDKRVHT